MQTKVTANKEKEAAKSTGLSNKNFQSKANNKRLDIRTTSHKKMSEIFLNDPNSVSKAEFLLFQSAIGYRNAVGLLEEGKRRKREEGKGTASNKGLPNRLRSRLEDLSGMDLSNVSVHKNSAKPQQVGALAYTKGHNIHIASGQEKHLPHEGWHAVQQMQGRVKSYLQMQTGIHENDNEDLEEEADIMGSRAEREGSQNDELQLKKASSIQAVQHEGNVIQKKSFFGKLFSGAKKAVSKVASKVVKQAAKVGAGAKNFASRVVKQGAKLGTNALKTAGNIVKRGVKAGASGLKAVGNMVKHGIKAGANGLKAVGNMVKHGVKAGANGLKAVGNMVKHGVKAGASGLKAVGNIVKNGAKLGLKTVGNIVKEGARLGAKGLKTVGNLVKQGAQLGAKGLKAVGKAVTSKGFRTVLSFGVGFIPVVGDIVDGVNAIVGRDIITGEKLSPAERLLSAASILLPGSGKLLRKGVELGAAGIKGAGKLLKGAGGLIKNALPGASKLFKKGLKGTGDFIKGGLSGVAKFGKNALKGTGDFIKNGLSGASKLVKNGLKGTGDFIKNGLSGAGKFAKSKIDEVKKSVNKGADYLKSIFKKSGKNDNIVKNASKADDVVENASKANDVVENASKVNDVVKNTSKADDIRYEQYWEDVANGKYDIPYGMTGEEYYQYLKGLDKATKGTSKAIKGGLDAFGNLSKAADYGLDSYSALKKTLKGTGLEAHHIVEKRLAKALGNSSANSMLSVAVNGAEHQAFTNAWRAIIPYGTDYSKLSKDQIWQAAQKVYKNYPELLDAAKKTIFK